MKLYEGDLEQFREDVLNNRIADIMRNKANEYKVNVSRSEYRSWQISPRVFKDAVSQLHNNKIILEYRFPNYGGRIDVILFGKHNGSDQVVITELKQWSNDSVSDCEDEGSVIAEINGHMVKMAHPSSQVEGYYLSLIDNLQVFDEKPEIKLHASAYCHNYSRENDKVLYQDKFKEITDKYPLFTKEDNAKLGEYLRDRLVDDNGIEVFNRFVNSPVRPSKGLIQHVGDMINKQQIFNLIDEQIPARNAIISRAKELAKSGKKFVIIVKGGPGTGKSVIALETMAELLRKGKNVFYATGSSAFTNTLRKVAGKRAKDRFKYFFSFTRHKENEIDVLVCDEAHRLRKNSADYGVPSHLKSELPQVEDLIRPARLTVFFIDEHQIVRPSEVGDVALIRQAALKLNAEVEEFDLKTQFRCGGSEAYLQWLENTLGITESEVRMLGKNEQMEFKIFDSPEALRDAIYEKNKARPNFARIAAGFCWPWSKPNADGSLVNDVKIGSFEMPWERKDEFWKWATDESGMEQVGTVYTAQGFEFDYIGVIFGKDLIYDKENNTWKSDPKSSHDSMIKRNNETLTKHLKNVYRVLMSRAHKGVYIYFMDKDTENFFKSRVESYNPPPR
ncbi:MAG: DUF2075 domain-containing protein [Candidatus Micrarchaeota archaeon]|nr:DUF2075 domain-containing protein [Candidatus Micrarchaeota archaeon]